MRAALIIAALTISACQAQPYNIVGDTIPMPLTNAPTDASRGQALFTARDGGHCILCHAVTRLDAEFQGNLGPSMDGIGAQLSAAQLRLRIVDYDAYRPGTTMPSYFRTRDLRQVGQNYAGQTVLSAQDIEDIIAYLMTLNEME